jgi:hypothetical protein
LQATIIDSNCYQLKRVNNQVVAIAAGLSRSQFVDCYDPNMLKSEMRWYRQRAHRGADGYTARQFQNAGLESLQAQNNGNFVRASRGLFDNLM